MQLQLRSAPMTFLMPSAIWRTRSGQVALPVVIMPPSVPANGRIAGASSTSVERALSPLQLSVVKASWERMKSSIHFRPCRCRGCSCGSGADRSVDHCRRTRQCCRQGGTRCCRTRRLGLELREVLLLGDEHACAELLFAIGRLQASPRRPAGLVLK